MLTTETLTANKALAGFVKIWRSCKTTGNVDLLVDKQNMILKGGATLVAQALGGKPEAKIWGMYIGYNNLETFNPPAITVDYANPFAEFNEAGGFGYLREPLTFTPSYMSSEGYTDNTVLFSTMITSATNAGGAEFTTDSRIYEVALVAVGDPDNSAKDVVFSRTNFTPVKYDSSFNFTITWGVRILLP